MDDSLFTEYVTKYSNTVYRVAFNFLRSIPDSEDIMQDTFIKLYRCKKKFNDSEHIKAWLIRVAINLSKNHIRQSQKHQTQTIEENTMQYCEDIDSSLAEALDSLNESYRTAIYLHYYEGYDVKEVARLLDISESSAKMRLMRGREKLKAFLA